MNKQLVVAGDRCGRGIAVCISKVGKRRAGVRRRRGNCGCLGGCGANLRCATERGTAKVGNW